MKQPWRERVSSAYCSWWRAMKENRRLRQISAPRKSGEAFRRNVKALAEASRQLHTLHGFQNSLYAQASSAILAPVDGEEWPWRATAISDRPRECVTTPEADAIFRTLVFLKFGLSFRELISQMKTNPEAHQKLLGVHKLWYQFLWDGVLLDDMKLKFSLNHFQIISQGLDLGLATLNEWELADCLDEICPCGQPRHSAEYLRKLRMEIIKACESLVANTPHLALRQQ